MKQAIIKSKQNIVIEEVPLPKPGRGEVLTRVEYNAICGSEIPAYLGLATSTPHYLSVVEYPYGPFGHEGVGEVAELGDGVTNMKVGDRVVATGGYWEFALVPAKNLTKIPDGISYKDASISAMALEAQFAAGLIDADKADSVFISGMGPAGLLILEALREIGCAIIICSDLIENRLKASKKLGATHTVNPQETDIIKEIKEITSGKRVSIAIDTTGLEVSIKTCFKAAGRFGKVGLFSRGLERMNNFEIEDIFHKFLTVYGLKCHPYQYTKENYEKILYRITDGRIHPDVLITHEFPLDRINDAFEMAAVKKEGLKIVVKCS